MDFVKLTTEMLSFRLGVDLEIDPDWFVAHLDDVIRFNPDGCFALIDNDRVIGMITSTIYRRVGWLGWLFVLPEYRYCGFGESLMLQGIDHIRSRGIGTILLEADLKAVSLYHRLGFKEQFHTRHYTISASDLERKPGSSVIVRKVGAGDLDAIAAFDRQFFHEDRLSLFKTVAYNPNFRGFTACIGDHLAGYLFVTEATENQQVSPMIVDVAHESADGVISALISEAFLSCSKPLYFRLPTLGEHYGNWLERIGAEPVYYHTVRMYLGESYETEREGVLSLGCPGKG